MAFRLPCLFSSFYERGSLERTANMFSLVCRTSESRAGIFVFSFEPSRFCVSADLFRDGYSYKEKGDPAARANALRAWLILIVRQKVMKKARLSKAPWILASLYLAWSGFVYFGSLLSSGDSHAWWPMFLYPLIWPWSGLYEGILGPIVRDLIIPDPKLADEAMWMMTDYVAGAYYVLVGVLWFWLIGFVISRLTTRFFGHQKGPNQVPEPTSGLAPGRGSS